MRGSPAFFSASHACRSSFPIGVMLAITGQNRKHRAMGSISLCCFGRA